jgi:hypothetical protein
LNIENNHWMHLRRLGKRQELDARIRQTHRRVFVRVVSSDGIKRVPHGHDRHPTAGRDGQSILTTPNARCGQGRVEKDASSGMGRAAAALEAAILFVQGGTAARQRLGWETGNGPSGRVHETSGW